MKVATQQPKLEQPSEKPAEHHGISDVGYMNSSKQSSRVSSAMRLRQPDRILAVVGGGNFDLAAILAHTVMHVAHELMEVSRAVCVYALRKNMSSASSCRGRHRPNR